LGITVFMYTQTGKHVYPDAYMEHMYASVRHIYALKAYNVCLQHLAYTRTHTVCLRAYTSIHAYALYA
jgi:hypothetical protein